LFARCQRLLASGQCLWSPHRILQRLISETRKVTPTRGFRGPNTTRPRMPSLADGDGFHLWPWHGFPQSQLGLNQKRKLKWKFLGAYRQSLALESICWRGGWRSVVRSSVPRIYVVFNKTFHRIARYPVESESECFHHLQHAHVPPG
jgi:hypothetical protein